MPEAAFVAAMLTLFVVFVLAQRGGRVGPSRLVLAGVAVSYLATAGTSFVQLYTRPAELRHAHLMCGDCFTGHELRRAREADAKED